MRRFISRHDLRVMTYLSGWRPPRWIRLWMICATRGGDGWLWYSVGLLALLFGGRDRFRAIGAASLSTAAGAAIFVGMKRTFRRKRPCALGTNLWTERLPPDQFSFPSGHTITAFAMAVAMNSFYPAMAAALFFCAISIAISRVLLGMHFLSDVLAGAAIGAGLGYAGYRIFAV